MIRMVMNKVSGFIVSGLIFAFIVMAVANQAQAESTTSMAIVMGTISDSATGDVVDGATVHAICLDNGNIAQPRYSAPNGRYAVMLYCPMDGTVGVRAVKNYSKSGMDIGPVKYVRTSTLFGETSDYGMANVDVRIGETEFFGTRTD